MHIYKQTLYYLVEMDKSYIWSDTTAYVYFKVYRDYTIKIPYKWK